MSDDESGRGPGGWWPLPERALLPNVLGLPPWAAVGLAAALTTVGVCVDLYRIGSLGAVFTACYLIGCLLSVVWVRRRALFWTLVAPPLLVAVAVPAVVLLAGSVRSGTGFAERALSVGAPLVNAFPVMASTTALVLAVGGFRMFHQRLGSGRVSARRGSAADAAP